MLLLLKNLRSFMSSNGFITSEDIKEIEEAERATEREAVKKIEENFFTDNLLRNATEELASSVTAFVINEPAEEIMEEVLQEISAFIHAFSDKT